MSNLREIVIDPGHYGNYNMGCSRQYYESVGMLKLSRLIRDKLNATNKVHASLTRDNATDIDLYTRGKIAADRGAFIFISEHSNAGVSSAKGVECFHSIDIPSDKVWADKLSLKVSQVMGTTNRGAKIKESEVTKGEDYLGVIDSSQDNGVPHVFLIESGFHSNVDDEAKLRSDVYLNKIAIAQCQVICEMCGFTYSEVVAKPVTSTLTSGVVTATVLNVRSKPEVTPNNVIGQLHKGDRVKIAKKVGNWYDIYFGDHGGYVSADYIK